MIWKKYRFILFTALCVLVLTVAINIAVGGKFLEPGNLKIMLMSAAIPTFIAWGLCFIFASGVADFSIGSIVMLSAITASTLGNAIGLAGVLLGGFLVGLLCVTLNFAVYRFTKVSPWIAGLGMTLIYESITLIYSQSRSAKGQTVAILNSGLRFLGYAPAVYIILLLGFALVYVLYNKSSVGLQIRAMGSDGRVAAMMGIKVGRAFLWCGLVAGIFIGIAGVLFASYNGQGYVSSGLSSISTIFKSLAAVLLAQVIGHRVNITLAIPITSLFIIMLFNASTMLGMASGTWQEITLGAVIICAGVLAQRKVKGVVK